MGLSCAQLPRRVDSVGEGLGEVRAADRMGAVEIGDRARQLQDTMKAARRKR